ncbi:MAG: hypothetical protein V3U19_11360 [Thermodesulfobacteriota bacterium]
MKRELIYQVAIFFIFFGLILFSGCIEQTRGDVVSTTTIQPIITKPPTTASTTTVPPTTTTPAPEILKTAKALFESKCSVCHSPDRPRSKRKTRDEWSSTVKRMQDKNGARTKAGLTDADAEIIIDYLAADYGK